MNCKDCTNKRGSNILVQNPQQSEELDSYISSFEITDKLNYNQGHLISCLHKAQNIFGYLPEEIQIFIADKLRLRLCDVASVVSFYSFFTDVPPGKYKISVCMGTACFVKGADKILKEFEKHLRIKNGETTRDKMFSLCALRCIGACSLAPVIHINDKVYPNVTLNSVPKIIKELKKNEQKKTDC